jgi:polysaccharide export outer membrane protein
MHMQMPLTLLRGLFPLARFVLLGWVMLAGLGVQAQGAVPAAVSKEFLSSYKLGPGDVLTIRVFGEDDLSREKIRLTDTGSLFLPGAGEIVVLGKTLGEVERMAVERLKGRILVNPQVSVFVEEYRPFFINGMVDKPGGYPFQPGLTVRKAAALAGGFKERASLKKIFLISANDPLQRPVNVDLNTPILPGDIVTVEESFF